MAIHSFRSTAVLAGNILVGAAISLLALSANAATMSTPAPAWAQSMTEGTWQSISQNRLADLDPAKDPSANPNYPNDPPWAGKSGQRSVTATWNGGAFASGFGSKGSLIAWGGGHQDYYGNELYAFDMSTQRWSRLTKPFTQISFPVNNGIWGDGSPSVTHTSSYSGYHPGTNSFACMLTQTSNNFYNANIAVFFDFDTQQWRHGPRNPSDIQYGGWAVYDASRDAWWMEGGDSGGGFSKYTMNGDGKAGSWTNFDAYFSALDSRAGIDPAHDVLVVTTFRQNTSMYGIDLKNPGGGAVQLKQGGSPPTRDGAAGWEWSDARKAFIYWRSGKDVYEVKLSGSDWKTGTWMWTRLTAGSNSVTPQADDTGVYNRFQLARYSDMEIAVVVNSVDGPVYAFRMPGGAPLVQPNPPSSVTAQ